MTASDIVGVAASLVVDNLGYIMVALAIVIVAWELYRAYKLFFR